MHEFWSVMALPVLACVVLTGIHAYLGFHVIERQVIFVDLALAQIAVLGASVGLVFGFGLESTQSYWLALVFTVLGAVLFAMTRFKKQRVPQEAVIGIIYIVCAALLIMVLSRYGDGDEHIRQTLIGNILLVRAADIWQMVVIYSIIAVGHWVYRRKFFLISRNPEAAFEQGVNVRFWDFLFYVSLGVVVTSSVKIAGVLLVFSFLVIPAVCAMLFTENLKIRLIIGWVVGLLASSLGMIISYYLDFPTGASVVCAFGVILVLLALVRKYVV